MAMGIANFVILAIACSAVTLLGFDWLSGKLSDIDRKRNRIKVYGKGNKYRHVACKHDLLKVFEKYYREFKPKIYLFEGLNGKYSKSSVNKLIKKYFGKQYSAHTFRAVYSTYLVDNNVNDRKASNMLGHESEKTIKHYYRYSERSLELEINPLNEVSFCE